MKEQIERNREIYEEAYGLNGKEKLTELKLAMKYNCTPSNIARMKKLVKVKYENTNK